MQAPVWLEHLPITVQPLDPLAPAVNSARVSPNTTNKMLKDTPVPAPGQAAAKTARPDGAPAQRSNLFICFADKEADFAHDLDEALRKRRRVSALDWEEGVAHEASPDVLRKIEEADTFVFVISPSSLDSEVCRRQLEHAARLRKVIVPVLRVPYGERRLPPMLALAEAVDYRPEVEFKKAFEAIIAAVNTNLRIDVFLCYARADRGFVGRLYGELTATGRTVWFDLNSLLTGEVWENEIYSGIEAADNFVVVISPDSMRPESFCHKEVAHALKNNKRVIPLYHREVDASLVPPDLAKIQRRDFPEGGNFEADFGVLLSDLNTDPDYVRGHTRLLTRATEWQRGGEDRSLLLRGGDLKRAEALLHDSAEKEPQFTNLQKLYVSASRNGASRTRNKLLAGVTSALVLTLALAVLLFFQRQAALAAEQEAVTQKEIAETQRNEAVTQKGIAETQRQKAEEATIEAQRQEGIAKEQEGIARQKQKEATEAAEAERKARETAERRRREAEFQRQEAEIRGLRAEGATHEVTNRMPEALAFYRAAAHLEKETGRPTSLREIEQAAKQMPLSRVLSPRAAEISSVTVSPDASLLATASFESGYIDVWDLRTGQRLHDGIKLPGSVVQALAFSPVDKDLLGSVAMDTRSGRNVVRLWDARRGAERGPKFGVSFLAAGAKDFQFSRDGRLIAVEAAVLDITSGREVRLQIPQGNYIRAFALSPDGLTLAVGLGGPVLEVKTPSGEVLYNSAAGLFDPATGELLRPLTKELARDDGHEFFDAIAFSGDGKYIAAPNGHGLLRAWEAASGHHFNMPRTDEDPIVVRQLAFAPEGATLVTTDSFYSRLGVNNGEAASSITVWDLGARRVLRENMPAHTKPITSIAFSDDGKRFATSSLDWTAKLWSAEWWEPLEYLKGHQAQVYGLAFVPRAHDLVTGSADHTVRIWPLAEGRVAERVLPYPLSVGPDSWVAGLSRDGSRALVKTPHWIKVDHTPPPSERPGLAVYDMQDGRFVSYLQSSNAGAIIGPYVFSKDSKHVAALAGSHAELYVWDAETGSLLGIIKPPDCGGDSCLLLMPTLSEDFTTAAFQNGRQTYVGLWRLGEDRPALELKTDSLQVPGAVRIGNTLMVNGLALSSDGSQLAVAFSGAARQPGDPSIGIITLWQREGASYMMKGKTAVLERVSQSMAFVDGGRSLLVGTVGGEVVAVDPTVMEPVGPGSGGEKHRGPVASISCSDRNFVCATAALNDERVKIWDVGGGLSFVRTIDPVVPIGGILLSPDGSRLITLPDKARDASSTLRVWDTRTGDRIDALAAEGWTDQTPLAFTRDLDRIALAASAGAGLRLWVTRPFGGDPLLETGGLFNIRLCKESRRLVPVAVVPFPAPDSIWASKNYCGGR